MRFSNRLEFCRQWRQIADKLVLIFKCLLAREYARARIQSLACKRFSIRSGQGFLIGNPFAETMNTVVGITGASGVVYGVRLLEKLPPTKTVIVSDDAQKIARLELGISKKDIHELADFHYANEDMYSPLASGSVGFDSFVLAPCSTSTMSKIAVGIADNLITRIASVALKERRKLVLLLRETPLSTIHLSNMERLSLAGAIIMPASPAFYPRPRSVDEMVDFVVGRVMDEVGIDNDLYARWKGVTASTRSRGSRRTRR